MPTEPAHDAADALRPLPVGQHIIDPQVVSPLRDLFGVDVCYFST
jgi:hypothetical protein